MAAVTVASVLCFLWFLVFFIAGESNSACARNIPAICLNVGPMLNGYLKNDLAGSGMVVWRGREMYAAGEMDREEFTVESC